MSAVYERLIAQVPPLPPACRRVLAVASGDPGAAELADAIALDPRMSMQLLRVANSPFFGRVTPAQTVTDAVVTVGVVDAARITSGTAMLAELAPPHPPALKKWGHTPRMRNGGCHVVMGSLCCHSRPFLRPRGLSLTSRADRGEAQPRR